MSDEPKKAQFAMVPDDVLEHFDSKCVHLYAWVDRRSGGKNGRPVNSLQFIADGLGWQPRTVREHARHLADAGLIDYEQEGLSAARMGVRHNPARGQFADRVVLRPRVLRARPPARTYVTRETRDVSDKDDTRETRDTSRAKRGSRPFDDTRETRDVLGAGMEEGVAVPVARGVVVPFVPRRAVLCKGCGLIERSPVPVANWREEMCGCPYVVVETHQRDTPW